MRRPSWYCVGVMRSPFPGMDPWLEFHWRDVHASLIIYIRNQLQRQLPEPLVARAEEDVFVDIDDERSGIVRPDVEVSEDRPEGQDGGGVATLAPPVTIAEPLLLRVPEPEVHRRVEIYDPDSGNRVVTAIEVLSPSNKLPGTARTAYLSKQRDFLRVGVNLVEIDLVREGDWVFSVDEALLPARKRTPYMACVFRATRLAERAVYLISLRERLPRIAIPLRPRDRDVALDLQQVIDEAYETGRYDRTNYQRPLDPPLPPADADWVREVLRKAGRI
jgi:hypothetical protein